MQKTKKEFYRQLLKVIVVFCLVVMGIGGITQILYSVSPVEFRAKLDEMNSVPANYLYISTVNPSNGYSTGTVLDLRTSEKLLQGDYGYAGAISYGSSVQYIFEGISEGNPKAVYEFSSTGVEKLNLTPEQLRNINSVFTFDDQYALFLFSSYRDKAINYEFYTYNRDTKAYSQISTSAIDSRYLTGKDVNNNPLYWASFYADRQTQDPQYAVIEFNSDFDIRQGTISSTKYSFDPRTGVLEQIEEIGEIVTTDNSEQSVVLDDSFSNAEIAAEVISSPINLIFRIVGMLVPTPQEYYSVYEDTVYYSNEPALPAGPYLYITQPFFGKQKLIGAANTRNYSQEHASWFSTRYHYYTRFISIPQNDEYIIVQVSGKIALLELRSGKIAELIDLGKEFGFYDYQDFTTGKVMIEVF